ncbi:MAG: acetyl-CoA C-acyltransferase [Actinomycetota bacterium]|nr:acetyl-CoA C-acyltransferase [Actinomycetota bacterium]
MNEVVIVEAGRSAVGKRNGSLAGAHPADVLGPVMMEVLSRAGVDSSQVGQVVGGCINKVGAQAMNVTRTAWLSHGGDENVACTTIDAQCGSSQQAVNTAHALIAAGVEDVVMACGVEAMSLLPIGSDAFAGAKAGLGKPVSRSYFEHYEFLSQFEGAERIAEKYEIDRSATDAYGLRSQELAATAIAEGRFETQIIEVTAPVLDADGKKTDASVVVSADEIPRDTSLEKLASLKPVAREDGVHTAGSSSQIADGASAVLLMSADKAAELGLRRLARVKQTALVGCDPELMLEGPIPATRKVLAAEGITVDDVDVFEINEAFASVVLAWAKELQPDMDRVNPNGGAISLGHPLGATGCFLTTKAVHELQRTGGRYAVITMCCGGGLGTGTLIERI